MKFNETLYNFNEALFNKDEAKIQRHKTHKVKYTYIEFVSFFNKEILLSDDDESFRI